MHLPPLLAPATTSTTTMNNKIVPQQAEMINYSTRCNESGNGSGRFSSKVLCFEVFLD